MNTLIFRPDPTSPGPGRDGSRRPDVGESRPAAGFDPDDPSTWASAARSWPARDTCGQLVAHPRVPGLFRGCVLPPHDVGTCLPAPRGDR